MSILSSSIEYNIGSRDNPADWQMFSSSYSGSVTTAALNEFLTTDLGKTKAYFKTYVEGSDTGSSISNTQITLIGGLDMSFTSYYKVKEHKYMCVVNRGEFNKSSNPSLYDASGSEQTSITQVDTSGSAITMVKDDNFRTFATGIGLYDDSLQLIAYAKFANPIKIRNDFDSVFIVKFDI